MPAWEWDQGCPAKPGTGTSPWQDNPHQVAQQDVHALGNDTWKGIPHACACFYPLGIQSCLVWKTQWCLEHLSMS